jgi:solute carrier family 25 carnitine/acylcarnitine transporter 20/29
MSIADAIDMTAGVAGGIVVVLTGHPFDTTKTRLQTAPPGFYTGTLDCVKKTLKWEGLNGFFTGIQSPLCGNLRVHQCNTQIINI